MPSEPYRDPQHPAPDILTLIAYLSGTDDGTYLYRGQVRRYEGPLLPSAFRTLLRSTPEIPADSPDTTHSLRKVGRRFLGNFIWDREDHYKDLVAMLRGSPNPPRDTHVHRDGEAYFQSHFKVDGSFASLDPQPSSPLETFLQSTTSTIEYNALAQEHGHRQAATIMLHNAFPDLNPTLPPLHKCIDDYHRDLFHRDILVNSFGYLIGSLISQHYGFSSGCLDATTSIKIAAFFATHDSPKYAFVGIPRDPSPGVIYRFAAPESRPSVPGLFDIDYYNAPCAVVTHAVLGQLESHLEVAQSLSSMRRCFEIRTRLVETLMGMVFATQRRYDLLKLPVGCVATSRIGRQSAALVIPDEIHKGVRSSYRIHPLFPQLMPDAAATPIVCQQSIEDLHYREGLQCYYFRHSDRNPCPDLSPVELWPNDDDFFLNAIAYLFQAGLSFHLLPGYVLPIRLDLIDVGSSTIDTEQLRARINPFLRSEEMSEEGDPTAACLESDVDRQLYLVYRAATLSYQGHVTGDGQALRRAVRYVNVCRERDRSSIVLAAFEMLLNESLGDMTEVGRLRDEAVQMIEKECTSKSIETMGYTSAFHLFMDMYYSRLYSRRFNNRFAYVLYEMYQTS